MLKRRPIKPQTASSPRSCYILIYSYSNDVVLTQMPNDVVTYYLSIYKFPSLIMVTKTQRFLLHSSGKSHLKKQNISLFVLQERTSSIFFLQEITPSKYHYSFLHFHLSSLRESSIFFSKKILHLLLQIPLFLLAFPSFFSRKTLHLLFQENPTPRFSRKPLF